MNKLEKEEKNEIDFSNIEENYYNSLSYFFLYLWDKNELEISIDVVQKSEILWNSILEIYLNNLNIDLELTKKGYQVFSKYTIKDFSKIFSNDFNLFKSLCSWKVLLAFSMDCREIYLIINNFNYLDIVGKNLN